MPNPFPELQPYDVAGPRRVVPRGETESWLAEEMRRERDREVKRTVIQAPPPDQVARVTRLARGMGEAPLYIEGNEDAAERVLRANSIVDLMRRDTVFGQFAANNPRAVAAAQDDSENLGLLGNAWEGLKNVGLRFASGSIDTIAGLTEDADLLNPATMSEAIFRRALDRPSLAMLGQREQARRLRETAAPIRERGRAENWWAETALSGLEFVPVAAASALTRSPTLAAAIPAVSVRGNAVARAREQGLSEGQSQIYGTFQGGIEYATERIPAGTLVEAIVKRTPFGKALVRQLATELPGEQVATVLQDFTDWAMLPENENRTFQDYIDARPQAALATAVATAGGTTATTALATSLARTAEAAGKVSERVGQSRQAAVERRFFERAEKAIEGSKLRTRDPEAFRDLLRQQAAEAGATHVYIPGEAVQTFHQSDRYNPDDDPFAAYDVDEAAMSGGDIVIPIEDALTDLVGTTAWNAVKADVRLTPGGMSQREAQSFDEAMDDVMAELGEQAAEQDKAQMAERTTREKIVDRVAEMFGVSFTSPVARQIAEVFAQRVQTRAARLGQEVTGEELGGFEVRQAMSEGVAEVGAGERSFEQPAFNIADIKAAARQNQVHVDAHVESGAIWLNAVERLEGSTPGSGGNAVRAVLVEADRLGLPVRLRANAGPFEQRNPLKLVAYYERLGFRRDDPHSNEMTRWPASSSATFLQSDLSDGPRGRIIFDGNKRIIELFQSRNLSTPLHEFSHMWLEELAFDAQLPDAPDELKQDWETTKRYFAANGHSIGEDGVIPTDAHELWARTGERYFMEGKAPTSALVRLFESFRAWLVNIYKTVDRLRAPITPEIREVFDRLLATDEEIAAAQERQGLEALFKDAASVGMSEPEFAAYQRQVDDARAGAHASLLDKTMKAVRHRETERYRESRKGVKAEQQERIDAAPIYKALAAMKEQRVSREWIVDEMGEDALKLLPVRVPPLFVEGGVDPNLIAETAGYAGATEMLEAVIGAEQAHRAAKATGDTRTMRVRAIETATDEEMNRRWGDPLNDGSIEREALAAVHSEMQGEVIASEIRVLARKAGRRPTPYALARNWARGKIRAGTVAQEASPGAIQRYARNSAKAARAAEQAMLKQDVDEAFRQKQFQMLNSALLVSAKEAHDEVTAAVKRMDKIARAKTRKSVDQEYLEQAHALLEAVDLKQRTQKSLAMQGRWEAFAAAREAEGYDVVVPASFEATIGKTHWSKLAVENLLSLDEAVKQVIHLGRLKQTLLDNKERREFEEVVSEAIGGMDGMRRKPPSDLMEPSGWDAIKSRVAHLDAALLKMETVFDWLDRGNSNGTFNRIVFRPLAQAQEQARVKLNDLLGQLHEALEAVPKKALRRWREKVRTELLNPETGRPYVLRREQLVSMALNMGNRGNIDKLTGGYDWDEGAVREVLNRELSEEEWAYVQKVWDTIDSLWPEIEALEKRLNGVAPEKVEATPVETPFGTLRGGYFPVAYDPRKNYDAEAQAAKGRDLFENIYTRSTTPKGFTKERTAVQRPIHLSLSVVSRHVAEVVHDITHREAVMQADKFLTDKRVMRAVDETLGPEVRQAFRPWLQRIANQWAYDRAGLAGLEGFLKKMRVNATVVGMGFRVTTAMVQAAGYANSFEVVGERWIAPRLKDAFIPAAWRFVLEKSQEVAGRMTALDRDIADAAKRAAGGKKLSAATRFAFHGIGYMDRVVTIPTWLGAYDKALAQGMNEQDAVYAADKAVRQSQGAGAAKDLAAIQAGRGVAGELGKYLTMFYSFMSAFYQRQRTFGRDVRDARTGDIPKLMARAWWLFVVSPLLAELLAGRGPGDDDDDETWATWALQGIAGQFFGPIPIARDAVPVIVRKAKDQSTFGYRFTPAQGGVEALLRLADDAEKAAEGDETKNATRNVIELTGYATGHGLATGQVAAATQFLVDVGSDDADPESLSEWWEGLTTGRIKEPAD